MRGAATVDREALRLNAKRENTHIEIKTMSASSEHRPALLRLRLLAPAIPMAVIGENRVPPMSCATIRE